MAALSVYCPFCQRYTAVLSAGPKHDVVRNNYVAEHWWIAVCQACYKPMLVGTPVEAKGKPTPKPTIYPTPLPSPTDERIDERARRALVEAKVCLAAGAINASATMARRALQAGVVKKGATKNKLIDQIDELKDKGLITADLAAWAHEVRYAGNDGAHPEDEVTKEQAEDILELAEQFLTVLFVTPALAEERRKKRQGGAGP